MSQPKFLTAKPSELFANEWNSNIVSPENDRKLEESIRRNGLFKPIIVREVEQGGRTIFEILGGEHRWRAGINIGLTEVPIVNLGLIDDRRAKEISILDNARYGDDDALSLAEILKEIGTSEELQDFLPYAETDLSNLFSSNSIALDELDIDENFNSIADVDPEPKLERVPKTHTVMRFKVSIKDAERLTAAISKTQKEQGFTAEDDLTNAGDALIHLVMPSITAQRASDE